MASAPSFPIPELPAPSVLGPTLVITGALSAEEDLEIHGAVRGTVTAPAHCVRVEGGAHVEADVLARDLTVVGRASGKLTATEIVDIRSTAHVTGQVAAPRLVLEEGGHIQARVETRSVDAAVRVAQYRRQR